MPFLALGRLALMRSCRRPDRRSSPRRGSYSSPPSTTPNPTAKPRTDQTDAMRRNHQRATRKRRNRHSYKSAITAISSPYVTSSELQLARTITERIGVPLDARTCEARQGQICQLCAGRAVFVRSRQASQDRRRQGLSHRSQARTKTRPASRSPTGQGAVPAEAGYRLGSDRGNPNHGSTLVSKRVIAQIRSPVRVSTYRPTPWRIPAGPRR